VAVKEIALYPVNTESPILTGALTKTGVRLRRELKSRREGRRRPAEDRLIVEVWGWKSFVEPRAPSPKLKIGLMITAKAAGRLFFKKSIRIWSLNN